MDEGMVYINADAALRLRSSAEALVLSLQGTTPWQPRARGLLLSQDKCDSPFWSPHLTVRLGNKVIFEHQHKHGLFFGVERYFCEFSECH